MRAASSGAYGGVYAFVAVANHKPHPLQTPIEEAPQQRSVGPTLLPPATFTADTSLKPAPNSQRSALVVDANVFNESIENSKNLIDNVCPKRYLSG